MKEIRELRKANGDTIKQLAGKLSYDFSNLSKIERGIITPSLKILTKIADIYGVSVTYFMNDTQYSAEEAHFIKDLELSSENLTEKYNLLLDGKQLTPEESEFLIMMIRKLRETVKKNSVWNAQDLYSWVFFIA